MVSPYSCLFAGVGLLFPTPSFAHFHCSIVRYHVVFGFHEGSVFQLYFEALDSSVLDCRNDGWVYSFAGGESERFLPCEMRVPSLRATFPFFIIINFVFEAIEGLVVLALLRLRQVRDHILSNNKFYHELVEFLDGIGILDKLIVRTNWQSFVDFGSETVFYYLIFG